MVSGSFLKPVLLINSRMANLTQNKAKKEKASNNISNMFKHWNVYSETYKKNSSLGGRIRYYSVIVQVVFLKHNQVTSRCIGEKDTWSLFLLLQKRPTSYCFETIAEAI